VKKLPEILVSVLEHLLDQPDFRDRVGRVGGDLVDARLEVLPQARFADAAQVLVQRLHVGKCRRGAHAVLRQVVFDRIDVRNQVVSRSKVVKDDRGEPWNDVRVEHHVDNAAATAGALALELAARIDLL